RSDGRADGHDRDDALEQGDWERARKLFAAAGESAEALEGLGLAAWWLDEESALDARERAYRLYRERGESRGAGRVGDMARMGLQHLPRRARDRERLAPARPAPARGPRAVCGAGRARAARGVDGLVRVSRGDVAAGMAQLDEATAAAVGGEFRDRNAIGLSCCYLIFACERTQDFDRAGQWCERLAQPPAAQGNRALSAVCRAQYGSVLVLRGSWAAAERELGGATDALAVTRPGDAGDELARLGELRRRQAGSTRPRRSSARQSRIRSPRSARRRSHWSAAGRWRLPRRRLRWASGTAGASASSARRLSSCPAQARLELAATLALLGRAVAAAWETERAREALAALGVTRRRGDGSLTTREVEVLRLVAEGL